MTDSIKSFILGVIATTLLMVCALYLISLAAVNAKREACTKFADITGQQTTFITYGLTESLCFTNINGSWTDINPNKVNP